MVPLGWNAVTEGKEEKSPNTGDNITLYAYLLGISISILIGTGIYYKKEV